VVDENRRAEDLSRCIVTSYRPPNNSRGARFIATADHPNGRLVLPYPLDATNVETAHRIVAEALRDLLGWAGQMVGGRMPDGRYAWLLTTGSEQSKPRPDVAPLERCPAIIERPGAVGVTGPAERLQCRYPTGHPGPHVA
jgi:hypothetical protein